MNNVFDSLENRGMIVRKEINGIFGIEIHDNIKNLLKRGNKYLANTDWQPDKEGRKQTREMRERTSEESFSNHICCA